VFSKGLGKWIQLGRKSFCWYSVQKYMTSDDCQIRHPQPCFASPVPLYEQAAHRLPIWQSSAHSRILPSSTYMARDELFHLSGSIRRYAVYIANRTGETGEPCGIPTGCPISSEVKLLKDRHTFWSVRKEWAQSQYSRGESHVSHNRP
jgi:hypothetical protein